MERKGFRGKLVLLVGMLVLFPLGTERAYGLFDIELGGGDISNGGSSSASFAFHSRVDIFSVVNQTNPASRSLSYFTLYSKAGYFGAWSVSPVGISFGVGNQSMGIPESVIDLSVDLQLLNLQNWVPEGEIAWKNKIYSVSAAISWNSEKKYFSIGAFVGLTLLSQYSIQDFFFKR